MPYPRDNKDNQIPTPCPAPPPPPPPGFTLIGALYVATKTSRIPLNLNFLGETAFLEGIFCLEYPNIHVSQTADFHFANCRFSFRKLQIFISQTTDFHFSNYRFPFRKLQIPISQTTDFHFANYRFPFRFVSFRFVPFRFTNYSKPGLINYRYRIRSTCQCQLNRFT